MGRSFGCWFMGTAMVWMSPGCNTGSDSSHEFVPPEVCGGLELDDEEGGASVKILIRNATASPLFIDPQNVCVFQEFELVRVSDGVSVAWSHDGCLNTCEDAVAGSCTSCGACFSGFSALRLEPGATINTSWDGAIYSVVDLATECGGQACATECERRTQAEVGATFRITTRATDICQGENCACSFDESSCHVSNNVFGEPVITATAEFTYGVSTGVALTFE